MMRRLSTKTFIFDVIAIYQVQGVRRGGPRGVRINVRHSHFSFVDVLVPFVVGTWKR
jgi:hypothetical protein